MASADTPAERAFVAMRLGQMAGQVDRAAEAMAADLDLYRDDFTTRQAEQMRAHEARVQQMEADQAAWFKSRYDGDDESGPTDVGQGHGASGTGPLAPAPGPGPGQPNHAVELADAERIRSMSMQEYAALRAEFGVLSPTDMNRLFRETR